MRRIVVIILVAFVAAAALFGVLAWTESRYEPHGFAEAAFDWMRPVILTVLTLAGIATRGVYDELARRRSEHVDILSVLRRAFTARRFWMALIASPILLMGFYASLMDVSSRLLLAAIAYENGFFFRAVVEIAPPDVKTA